MEMHDIFEGAAYLQGPASPPQGQRHRCAGKVKFDSPALAHKVARRNGADRAVYRCQECGHYHLGSTPATGNRDNFLNRKARAASNLVRQEG